VVKLRHQRRKGGILLVRGVTYKLDSTGAIEVPEEHAALVLQGKMWRRVSSTPDLPRAPSTVVEVPAAPAPAAEDTEPPAPAIEDHTKAELLELANGMGLEVDGRWSKLKLVSAIREARKEK
jgi:hypothetical protein